VAVAVPAVTVGLVPAVIEYANVLAVVFTDVICTLAGEPVNVAVLPAGTVNTALAVGLTLPVYEPVPVVPLDAASVTATVADVDGNVEVTEYDVATPSALKPTQAASVLPVEPSKPRL
jgi:hypothetical protein